MDNRFGLKDLFVMMLLAAILVLMVLKMVQDDRQWDRLIRIGGQVDQQTRDLQSLRRDMREGLAINPSHSGDASPTDAANDPFARLRQAKQKPDYAVGDTVVEAFAQAVPTVNPLTAQDVYARILESRVCESLATTSYDTLEEVPMLAERWDKAPDGLSATFYLRHGVTFSNGESFDADDVVYTFDNLIMNEQITDGRVREYLKIITKVEKIDPFTVKFHFARPFYESFQRAAGFSILPKDFFSQFTPDQIRQSPALLIGTGAYRMPSPTEYTPGQPLELVRNERYWGVPGAWDRMIWKIIEKESTEYIAFGNGEIDIFGPTPEQHIEMIKNDVLTKSKQHRVFESVRSGYGYIAWNQHRGGNPTVFADKRVRQAMTMMVDRQRIIDELWLGFGTVADGPFHHLGPQHAPDVKPWPYDPARALALLKEAGFTRDGEGPVIKPDGRPFEFQLVYPAGSELYKKIAFAIRDNYARCGVNMKLEPQKWALLLKTLNERTFDAITLGWSSDLEVDIEQAFHSRTIADGDNRNSYSNPELDRLIDEAHVTLDRDARLKIWQECHRIIHEDQPYTFLSRQKARLWLDNRIENVQPMPKIGINYVSTWTTPIEWYVPKGKQR